MVTVISMPTHTETVSQIVHKDLDDKICLVPMFVIFFKYIRTVRRVFANGPGDLGSFPGRVIPKDFKNGTWYSLA